MDLLRQRCHFDLWICVAVVIACAAGTGFAAVATLDDAAERYRSILIEDIASSVAGAERLHQRVIAHDLAAAKQSWGDARAGWERSEVFTGGFVPQLDKEIDAWPEAKSGFHAIEAKLFGANRTDIEDETRSLVDRLTEVSITVRSIPLTPQGLLNGIAQLAYELGENKVDGGESRISGTSLVDMRNNVFGITRAYQTLLAPAIEATNPALATVAARELEALKMILDTGDLKQVDSEKLRALGEEFVVTLQSAAPAIGLKKPELESSVQ
jgi:iron uptake system EfeUOB component EfeO/EfeM